MPTFTMSTASNKKKSSTESSKRTTSKASAKVTKTNVSDPPEATTPPSPVEPDWSNGAYTEAPWDIIGSYFQDQHLERLVRHQVESYNLFVNHQILQTIDMFNPVHIVSEQDYDAESGNTSLEIDINFENFRIYRPQIQENNGATKLMFPQEARLRNFIHNDSGCSY